MAEKPVKAKLLFYASIVCLGLSSLSLMLAPFADFDGSPWQKAAGYAAGALFWAGLAAGYILLWRVNRLRKRRVAASARRAAKARLGIVCFFRTKAGMAADILCGVSLAGTLVALLALGDSSPGLSVAFISAFVFSFQMHGLLNGENYKYISNYVDYGGKNNV